MADACSMSKLAVRGAFEEGENSVRVFPDHQSNEGKP